MPEYVEIVVRCPDADVAEYSSVRINPSMVYGVETTLEQFARALPAFQAETGLQVEAMQRVGVASIEDFGKAMNTVKLVHYLADTMPSDPTPPNQD